MARPGDDDRILEECRVGEYVGLRIQPKTPFITNIEKTVRATKGMTPDQVASLLIQQSERYWARRKGR